MSNEIRDYLLSRCTKNFTVWKKEYFLTVSECWFKAKMERLAPRSKLWVKIIFNYMFDSKDRLQEYVTWYISKIKKNEKRREESKLEDKQKKKEYSDKYKVWDIVYNLRWYEQTNVDFYQIVAKKWYKVTLRPLWREYREDWYMTRKNKPVKDMFVWDDFNKMITKYWLPYSIYEWWEIMSTHYA